MSGHPLATSGYFSLPHTLPFHAVLGVVPLASVTETCSTAFVVRYSFTVQTTRTEHAGIAKIVALLE